MKKSFIPVIRENLKSNKALKITSSRKFIAFHDTKMFSDKQTKAD